jgi:hypothetical protein
MRVLTVVQVRGVPWWGVLSAALTPFLQIGGWTVADQLQPQPFDPVKQSVSYLASTAATDRWVMTLTFIIVAVCYAANPVAAPGSFSLAHALWSALGIALLAAWPLGAYRSGRGVPWALRPAASFAAVGVIVVLTGWFLVELLAGGGQLGLAERIVGIAQATWPLLVVASCQLNRSRLSI